MSRSFAGGVHPPEHKTTEHQAVQAVPVTEPLVITLRQSMGAGSKPVVQKGQEVLRGELLASAGGFISASIHAPTSGKIGLPRQVIDPVTGAKIEALVIEPDGRDAWHPDCNTEREWRAMSAEDIRQAVADGGIVGMGGATFPTHVKLTPPKGATIDTVILNGAECEPYLTCDHRLMLDHPAEIIEGLEIFMRAVGAPRGIVAMEDNKMDAHRLLSEAARDLPHIEVIALPVKYPQGAEKQLIKALLDREVPSGGLPADVGVVVQNVATAYATQQAVRWQRPLTERVLTLTGDGLERPGNLLVRVGTSVKRLLEEAGCSDKLGKLIAGGPMMGIAQQTVDIYTMKGMSGLLALKNPALMRHGPCIRCGRCVEACPARIMPSTLSILGESYEDANLEALDAAMEYGLMDCIECGSCSYICPAERQIVHYVRFLKGERRKKLIRERERQAQEASRVTA